VPRSIISRVLRRRQNTRSPITDKIIVNVLKNNSLLTPAEQANNLIMYLGEYLSSPGAFFEVPTQHTPTPTQENIYGLLGIKLRKDEWHDLFFLITSLGDQNLAHVEYHAGLTSGGKKILSKMSLTFAGWQRYEAVKRSVSESRRAFMAMEFPNSENGRNNYFFQETLLDKYLVPAVRTTGYYLANALRSEPKAGNIHARLEVEIRAARFIVAELSHHNNGPYWEAGFARGLEKPVIYMYNKKVGMSPRPHFDVGSDHIIFWEEDKPEKAADALKAVIRATLFGEAVMDD